MTIQHRGFDSSYIFRILSDFWDGYKERDQLATFWSGANAILDDAYIQNYQADFGKSLKTVPVYWRYMWSNLVFDIDQWEANTSTDPLVVGYSWRYPIDPNFVSAPTIQDGIDKPTLTSVQGTDHYVRPGWLYSNTKFTDVWARNLWVDEQTIQKNFGDPIDFTRDYSNVNYLYGTRGMWYVYWNGATVNDIQVGSKIIVDAPVSPSGTKVLRLTKNPDGSVTILLEAGNLELTVPPYLTPTVSAGQTVSAYQSLSDGVEVWDYINNPDWYLDVPGLHTMWKRWSVSQEDWCGWLDDRGFFDDGGFWDDLGSDQLTDYRIFQMIKYFVWVLKVDGSLIKDAQDAEAITHFADTLKPAYTDHVDVIESNIVQGLGIGHVLTCVLDRIVYDALCTPSSISADGVSTSTATASTDPIGRSLTWIISSDDDLGCVIDPVTGVITAGTITGTITVRATDDLVTASFAETDLTLT